VNERPPHNTAGTFLPMLREAGVLPGTVQPGCPAAGSGELPSYAYSLGYRDELGQLNGLRRDPDRSGWDLLPIIADPPPPDRDAPNPDHRFGQNVLFCGGNVRFCTSSNVGYGGDDIYRNQNGHISAGLCLWDSVLGVGADRP